MLKKQYTRRSMPAVKVDRKELLAYVHSILQKKRFVEKNLEKFKKNWRECRIWQLIYFQRIFIMEEIKSPTWEIINNRLGSCRLDSRRKNMENKPDNRKNGNQDPNSNGQKNRQPIFAFLICLLVTLTCLSFFTNMLRGGASGEITYDEFIRMVDDKEIKEVVLQDGTLTITPKESKKTGTYNGKTYQVTLAEEDSDLVKRLEGTGITFKKEPPDPTAGVLSMIISIVAPTLLLFGLFMVLMKKMNKGGGMMGVGKSKAKAYVQKETGVTFKDVGERIPAGGSGFSAQSWKIYRDRRKASQRRPSCGTAWYGKNFAGQGRGRRGACAVLFPVRFRFCGDVCGRRRLQSERFV